jgi:hypothetical protein
VIQLCGSLSGLLTMVIMVIFTFQRCERLKGYLVSMGSMFILLIRVICARVITGLVCCMFIERMPT